MEIKIINGKNNFNKNDVATKLLTDGKHQELPEQNRNDYQIITEIIFFNDNVKYEE